MARAILGTAGHIDHGKTALIRALTGVDTDRLPEERARGITIELGFAELTRDGHTRLGVVDVPGHEAFVRTMVAGATGMDIVLLVVAADEGIMPQTVEHLDIVMLLDVPELVVALTKSDVVDDEWLQMVDDDVRILLAETPYSTAPVVATSAASGEGLEALLGELDAAATRAQRRKTDDLARLPVDRVFTVQGTGTVVTGTLWSGSVAAGERVSLLPGGSAARIRGVQVHGRDVARAEAGARAALALAGLDRSVAQRGLTVVNTPGWNETWMLTVRARVLERAPRGIEHNQRVRVHLGTSEVLARCALLQEGPVSPGESGWIQLRLEEPAVARGRDRLVIRSYSPLITLGGGEVAEPAPPKRRSLAPTEIEALERILDGDPTSGVEGVLELAGWEGAPLPEIPVRCGVTPLDAEAGLASLVDTGAMTSGGRAFAARVVADAEGRLSTALAAAHAKEALRPVVGLDRLRTALPKWAHPGLAGAVLERMAADGTIELAEGGARLPGFEPSLDPDQAHACRQLEAIYAEAGLAPPTMAELPDPLRTREDLQELLRYLELRGVVRTLAEGLFIDAGALAEATEAVPRALGGRSGLGPADFREVLPVTRKHLIPLLQYLDGVGVTIRRGEGRDVAPPDGDGVARS
ncbi:MAG: selenocysteine-specific translation elongation factor [Gemmatimonadetes bacterium]|nr:selenocysteine-specific translation elongation factor [Gemmatimonadota bacterium]